MSRHSMRVVEALKGFYSALATVLRFPVIMGLLALDCTCGVLVPIYVGFRFGAAVGVASFLLIQSWLIYLVGKKIREESRESKIMKEGWEGRTDSEKVMEEYLKLIEENKQ